MQKYKYVVGIDVSSKTLDYSIYDGESYISKDIDYNKKEIIKAFVNPFKDKIDKSLFVMEATGVYHTQLAYYLLSLGFNVSVVNPLVIKRYSQLKLSRIKTDKADSKIISSYGYLYQNELKLLKSKSKEQIKIDNLIKAIDDLIKQKTITNNQLHSLTKQSYYSKTVANSYKRHLEFLNDEIKRLEKELNSLIDRYFKKEYKLLKTIPGIGLKVIAIIISIFNSFDNFDNAKKACSFIGIAPSPYQSGASVKKQASISKQGNSFARKILYMATLSATQHNFLIKQKYQRLLKLGKPKKVALIAAANKLLRQAYGILKSGIPFDENYINKNTKKFQGV